MKDPHFGNVAARQGLLALSPVILFILLYLGVSVALGDFYKMPIAVAMLAASAWAVAITGGMTLPQRIDTFSRAASQPNVLYMVWIFILAGAFASLAKEIGAVEATVQLTLRYLPAAMLVPGLFFAACFISMAIGTSVGTVVALAPLAAQLADGVGESVAFMTAVVLGGAFFGDNLSFISDTTIAATRTQGCSMASKFRVNIRLCLPAALISLVFYALHASARGAMPTSEAVGSPWLIVPYLTVIVMAVCGINVSLVLCCGIAASLALGLIYGHTLLDMAGFMGSGIDSMGNLIIITLLATGLLGMVKHNGGIDFLIASLSSRISGTRGAKAVIALLVGAVNLCTANNTVAILTVGPMAKDIADRFGVDPRRTASLLDTASCIVQALIPYGAQTLLGCALAGISPAAPWPYLFYPFTLAAVMLISILVKSPRRAY